MKNNQQMKTINHILSIFLATIFLFDCNKENHDTPPVDTKVTLRGTIQKGPFISGSTVIIQELDEGFVPTGKSINTTTNNDFGGYEIVSNTASPFLEIITDGFYFDEVKGEISSANITLRSITKNDSIPSNVNILTTLAKDRIIYLVKNDGYGYAEAKTQAQLEILNAFNIQVEDILDFNSMDISMDGDNNGILLAISSILQGGLSVGSVSELISKFILDIKNDGVISDPTIRNALAKNAMDLNLQSIRDNLLQRYNEINYSANIPPFEKYAKRLVSLMVVKTSPEIGEMEVPFSLDSICIYFNKSIDLQTINSSNIIIANASNEVLPGTFTYDDKDFKIIFNPEAELLPEENYTVVLTEGIRGIDQALLIGGYSFGFRSLSVNTNSGLLAYYTFSDSGTDITGNGFNASLINTSFVADMSGNPNQACQLSGSGSYIELPNVFNLTEPNWSYSIWLKLNQLEPGTIAMLLGIKYSGAAFSESPLYIRSSNGHVTSYNMNQLEETAVAVQPGSWYHIAAIIENSVMSIYINGDLAIRGDSYFPHHNDNDSSDPDFYGTDVGLFNYYKGTFLISEKIRYDLPAYIDGIVDNVRFYNRPLNKFEVKELFSQKK